MASFSIPLTGLQADSTALNTIANDLSNMNTTAFKSQTTNFSDLFYQQVGSTAGGDPIQVGAGVQVASNATSYTEGPITSTGNNNDVALNGSGFFVVETANGGYQYTRAGDFSTDANGRRSHVSSAIHGECSNAKPTKSTNASSLQALRCSMFVIEHAHDDGNTVG